MVRATYLIQVDWNNNGVYTDANEDITGDVRALEFRRGRDFDSSPEGLSSGGWLKMSLENSTNKYSPSNTAGALTGNLLPGRKVRVQADTTTLWTGFIQRIMPQPHYKGDKVCFIEAVGPLGYINQRRVSTSMQASKTTGALLGVILDRINWPAADRDIDAGKTTVTRHWAHDLQTLEACREIENTEAGFLWEKKDGKIAFDDRHTRFTGTPLTSQATFSDASGAARPYQAIMHRDNLAHIFNAFPAEVTLFSVGALAELWRLPESGAASPLLSATAGDPNRSKTFIARYPVGDSPAQDVAVDAWTTPIATTDYTANAAADGSGADLTADITPPVVGGKLGQVYESTYANSGATPAYLTLARARGTPVSVTDAVRTEEIDSTSRTNYGERSWPSPSRWSPSASEAILWGTFMLSRFRNPVVLLTLSYIANKNANLLAEMKTRDINDRVTIVANGNAGLGINEDFFIEAEHHVITPRDGLHIVTYELSQALPAGLLVWVLGSSLLGTGTRLGF